LVNWLYTGLGFTGLMATTGLTSMATTGLTSMATTGTSTTTMVLCLE